MEFVVITAIISISWWFSGKLFATPKPKWSAVCKRCREFKPIVGHDMCRRCFEHVMSAIP
jgi:hypothetical protein